MKDIDKLRKQLPLSLQNNYTDEEVLQFFGNLDNKNTTEDGINLEDVMYDFLSSVLPAFKDNIMLKGCLALKSYINKNVAMRLTQDIDLTVKSQEVWEQFLKLAPILATEKGRYHLEYHIVKRRGYRMNGKSDSIVITATKPNWEYKFKLDMNIKTEEAFLEKPAMINGSNIMVYALEGILADKLSVLRTQRACRRIKDLLDVYTIATTHDFDLLTLVAIIFKRYPDMVKETTPIFILQEEAYEQLEHAYNKYQTEDYEKPKFGNTLALVQKFTFAIYKQLRAGIDKRPIHWYHKKGEWKC